MARFLGRPVRLPNTQGSLKVYLEQRPEDENGDQRVDVWWEQRFFLQLLLGKEGCVLDMKGHRANEKKCGILERILRDFELPGEASCSSRTVLSFRGSLGEIYRLRVTWRPDSTS